MQFEVGLNKYISTPISHRIVSFADTLNKYNHPSDSKRKTCHLNNLLAVSWHKNHPNYC